SARDHLSSALVPLLVAAVAAVGFGRLRPGLRAAMAACFGTLALVAAGVALAGGVAGSDFTGLLLVPAGLALIALAFAVPWGESEGSPNAFGWGWQDDVEGAVDFLEARADVDRGRIGGLGLSTGADVLLQVAARDRRLAAVVSDGASGESFADYRNLKGIDVS